MEKIKVLFMGTPSLANEILKSILKNNNLEVVGVVTQPDKPVGRKNKLTPPPVKVTALNNGIACFQPQRVRKNKELREDLKNLNPDFILVVAFGQILPPSVLKIPKYNSINIHTSVLPKYRGASPIQSALLNRDKKTGVTFMEMNSKMDEGDIFLIREVVIDERDDYFSLEKKLIEVSKEVLKTFFLDVKDKRLLPVPQNHKEATYCKKISKEDGYLDFNLQTDVLIGKIRAFSNWPRTYFKVDDKTYIVLDANGVKEEHNMECGKIEINKKQMKIYTKDGHLNILKIQPQAKKPMDIPAFYNGIGRNLNNLIIK